MTKVHRSAIVPRPAETLFGLVDRVEDYPARFSWCTAAVVLERSAHAVVARLELKHAGLATSFTTRNTLFPFERIEMQLVDGPFSRLEGAWRFRALGDAGSKVTLDLHYAISNKLLGSALAVGFRSIADRMVDDFVRAALAGA
ncbi:MAG TPA: type II toxin-antitoxin system RatA family toxin [Candidatus Saccharimonadia bacterium]|nr:type II toxin-antitoxin system RatA family toxin [Candidatus Saccharimonadia bacterium]